MARPRATVEHLKNNGRDVVKKYENYGDSSLVAFPKNTIMIEPPVGLGKKAKDAWLVTIPCLLNMGVLGPLDLPALEQGFHSLDECHKALKALKEFDKAHKGEPIEEIIKKRQLIKGWYSSSLADYVKFISRFGITPEARSHLNMTHSNEKDDDPLDVILEGC